MAKFMQITHSFPIVNDKQLHIWFTNKCICATQETNMPTHMLTDIHVNTTFLAKCIHDLQYYFQKIPYKLTVFSFTDFMPNAYKLTNTDRHTNTHKTVHTKRHMQC